MSGETIEMTEEELAEWTAGFFDAEGYIRVRPHVEESYFTTHVSARQSSPQYISGLFDGDGCISLDIYDGESGDSGYPKTTITLVHSGDSAIQSIRNLALFAEKVVGLPKDGYGIQEREGKGESHSDSLGFRITTKEYVKRFLEHLIPYMFVKRKQAELMVEEIIPRLDDGVHHGSDEGFLEIIAWKEVMDSLKDDRDRSSQSLSRWEDELGTTLPDDRKPDVNLTSNEPVDISGYEPYEGLDSLEDW